LSLCWRALQRGTWYVCASAAYVCLPAHAMVSGRQVDPSQLYNSAFSIWMSTGTSDPVFTVSYVEDVVSDLRYFGYNVTFRKYSGAHSLGNQQEVAAAVQWWLSGSY